MDILVKMKYAVFVHRDWRAGNYNTLILAIMLQQLQRVFANPCIFVVNHRPESACAPCKNVVIPV